MASSDPFEVDVFTRKNRPLSNEQKTLRKSIGLPEDYDEPQEARWKLQDAIKAALKPNVIVVFSSIGPEH